jgi:DNA replication and repair protein RecF
VYRSSAGLEVDGSQEDPVPDRDEVAAALEDALGEVEKEERHRGVTLVGPHRDDLEISVRDLPSRGYASHGQLWSLALALRLASRELLVEVGDEPVVLLDDVFAELDETRRSRLGERCATWGQVLVTTAVETDAPVDGPRLDVRMIGDRSTVAARGVA